MSTRGTVVVDHLSFRSTPNLTQSAVVVPVLIHSTLGDISDSNMPSGMDSLRAHVVSYTLPRSSREGLCTIMAEQHKRTMLPGATIHQLCLSLTSTVCLITMVAENPVDHTGSQRTVLHVPDPQF